MTRDRLALPRALPRNGHVVILAMSSPSEMDKIRVGARRLEERGLRVTLATNIDAKHRGYLAGSDELRLEELNRHLRDPQYDAFFFARGGYGAMRILEQVDYDAIAANPRPVVGFSDVTALHQAIALRAGVGTFHGPMVNLDWHDGLSPDIEEWFWSVLSGESPLSRSFGDGDVIQEGEAAGMLFGGCLTLTTGLLGTPFDFWIEDGIWFWEEVDERPYAIDRMLTHLRLSGRMKHIRGVIIGRLRSCGSDDEVIDLLTEFFSSWSIPVVRNLSFGHHGDNLLMPIGVPVRLSTDDKTMTLLEPAVAR